VHSGKQAARPFAALTAALEKEADSDLAYLLVQLDDPSSYALIRRHFDSKRFVGTEHSFTRYLGKHGVDPVQEKQSHCNHRWRRAHTTERMDICDDCGLYWYYFDGRGDAIPDAEVSRPVVIVGRQGRALYPRGLPSVRKASRLSKPLRRVIWREFASYLPKA